MMRVLILTLPACIVSPTNDETGLEPDVDVDGDSDSDSDGDTDSDSDTDGSTSWNAEAISFDFSGAIVGGEIVDGAILSGKRHDASFGISLMATGNPKLRNCNVRYLVAGAPSSVDAEVFEDDYWRSWDFSDVAIDDVTGDCSSITSVFTFPVNDYGDLESLLAAFDIQMGLEDMQWVDSHVEEEWEDHWSFGDWDEDRPYLAAGGLYLAPFNIAYEMNVFQGYAMDLKTMEVEGDGFDLVPLPMKGSPDVPDGFYTASPMFVIGTAW